MHLKYVPYSNTTQNKTAGEGMQIVFCWFGFHSYSVSLEDPMSSHKGAKESRVKGLGKGWAGRIAVPSLPGSCYIEVTIMQSLRFYFFSE